ncbi:response regulator [Pontibacter locisalis]|uniref:Response regulator n=1 Tax=Pontibacter locisalis TaxID=1719035 RepID=A0ABW5ILW8_9BACT
MAKILIADNFALIREGIKKVLHSEPEITVVAETDHGGNVLRLVEKHKIDIVLLDINIPGMHGLDILKDLKKHFQNLPVLMLSMHPAQDYALRSLKLGASGYLRKDSPTEELVKAVQMIRTGGKYIPFALAEQLANWMAGNNGEESKHAALSNREFDIMQQLATGTTLKQIAETLNITVSTATTYKNRMYKKMGFSTNADLLRYCFKNNLIL